MKNASIRIAFALSLGLISSQPAYATGNDNPTGVTGQYNGSITTAGAYDPYTGSAHRTVEDISVTGAVGAYPLKWSRTLNTRNVTGPRQMGRGGWTHSYDWGIYLRTSTNPDHWNDETPDYYEGPDAVVYYPDGRQVAFEGAPGYDYAGSPAMDTSVLLKAVGGGNYDLLMEDGGKVQFELGPYLDGTVMRTGLQAQRIVDPYGLITTFTRDSAGRLWRISEPEATGRYLQINYENNLIRSVEAFAGPGNLTETVSYVYNSDASLAQVNYDDGTYATYTYQGSNHDGTYAPLIRTCDDVRYAGPMGKIEYVFMPAAQGIDFGQIKGEKYPGMASLVSQVSYPAYNCNCWEDPAGWVRTETRADGATRKFQYGIARGTLDSYSDFKNQWSATSRTQDVGNPLFRRVNTDARMNSTIIEKEGHGKPIRIYNPPEPGQAATFQSFAYEGVDGIPYYLQIHGDELGRNTFYERDANHRVKKIWYGFDENNWNAFPTEEFSYNPLGQVLTHKMTSGGTETFEYDYRGRKTAYFPPATCDAIVCSDPDPWNHPTRYFYYEWGPHTDRLHHVVDPHGNATWYEYNARGQVTKLTHQNGTYTQSGYNPDGTLAWTADENHPNASWNVGERTRYTYDEYKRVLTVTNPMNETTTNSYALDWVNPLLHTTNSIKYVVSPMNKNVIYGYDENFRKQYQVAAYTTADEAWTWFDYDAVGNLISTTDPRGNSTTFGYDNRNRQISVTNALNETTWTKYDDVNNKERETRQDGTFRSWKYDSLNRLWKAEDWRTNEPANANQTTTYIRDHAGNAKSITDTKGAVYSFDYDALNRKTRETYPGASRTEKFWYDAAGNLVEYQNPAEQKKHMRYDERNRQYHSWWDDGVGPDVVTNFDPASRMTDITTNNGETRIAFGYDDANRKLWEDQTVAGYPTRRVETAHDADGNRAFLHVPGFYLVRYDYTQRNQLRTIYDGNWAPWFNYTYDVTGNMLKRQAVYLNANDSVNLVDATGQNRYDALNRPTMWENTRAGDVWFARSWQKYDSVNREVATWREEQGFKGEWFGYNAMGQLTGVAYNADAVDTGTPLNPTRTVNYTMTPDSLNRASMNDNGEVSAYTANALNQYEDVGGGSISYDDNFNLTGLGGFGASYDSANRLVLAQSGEDTAQFVYDGLGRCLKRTVSWETTLIAYDGWKPIVEWNVWDGQVYFKAWNVYGPGADEILWRYADSSGHLRYHVDRKGNVAFLLDGDGAVREKYTYDAFGQPTVTDSNGENPRPYSWYGNRFMFTGREYFPELGLYDYRNRFYHPILGRFLQTDPIGFDAGDMNLFRYCGDDPVNKSDPLGLADDYVQLSSREELLLETARANVAKPGMRYVEVWPKVFRLKPMTKMQAVLARGNARKLSGISVGSLEKRDVEVPGGTQPWVQKERLRVEAGWRAVIATHKHWNQTGYGESDWSGPDRTEARKGTIVERTDESQPGVWKRLVPRKGGGSYKEENFDHPLDRQKLSGNGSGSSMAFLQPTAAEIDAAHQGTGVPSLAAESVNFAPGAR